MKNSKQDVIKAHEHSIYNKTELEASEKCGCFYCLSIFDPSEIDEYIEEEPDETATCPFCFIDSVIGDRSDYPITEEFLKQMKRYWMDSGSGDQLSTPYGEISVLLDGEPLDFQYHSIDPDEDFFPDVDATYRLRVDVEPDGEEHLLKMQIDGCDVPWYAETGERIEALSFYKGEGKITLGCYGSFGIYEEEGFDYDGCLCDDGIEIGILPTTKTSTYHFGVCWIDHCTEGNDVQTWYGADPNMEAITDDDR